jgi:hypothetical protein
MDKRGMEATFCLMTSAGVSIKTDPPFDMEREKREPTWGGSTKSRYLADPDRYFRATRRLLSPLRLPIPPLRHRGFALIYLCFHSPGKSRWRDRKRFFLTGPLRVYYVVIT